MAARFAAANAPHASSTELRRSQPISRMPHRFDRRVGSELLPHPPDGHLDDVRPRVEVVAPHLREETLAADDLARMLRQVEQSAELAGGAGRSPRDPTPPRARAGAPRGRPAPRRRHSPRPPSRARGTRGSAPRPRSPGFASPSDKALPQPDPTAPEMTCK